MRMMRPTKLDLLHGRPRRKLPVVTHMAPVLADVDTDEERDDTCSLYDECLTAFAKRLPTMDAVCPDTCAHRRSAPKATAADYTSLNGQYRGVA